MTDRIVKGWDGLPRVGDPHGALYRIAREVTDEVMGAGAYAEANRDNPDPQVQEQVHLSERPEP